MFATPHMACGANYCAWHAHGVPLLFLALRIDATDATDACKVLMKLLCYHRARYWTAQNVHTLQSRETQQKSEEGYTVLPAMARKVGAAVVLHIGKRCHGDLCFTVMRSL